MRNLKVTWLNCALWKNSRKDLIAVIACWGRSLPQEEHREGTDTGAAMSNSIPVVLQSGQYTSSRFSSAMSIEISFSPMGRRITQRAASVQPARRINAHLAMILLARLNFLFRRAVGLPSPFCGSKDGGQRPFPVPAKARLSPNAGRSTDELYTTRLFPS
jgi:hypothetical protein